MNSIVFSYGEIDVYISFVFSLFFLRVSVLGRKSIFIK